MSNSEDGSNFINEEDNNSERERLIQRCSRLEAQVNTLKEVSSLRKSLLELREQEVKDLIEKLKIFESAIQNEKQSRETLSQRVDSAEKTCLDLTAKLQANIEHLAEVRNTYEEKIGNLVQELEKSDQDYQKRTDELNDSELRNIELNAKIEDYGKLIVDNEEHRRKLEEEIKIVSERNRAFSYQMNLLSTLFNETEGTPIDFERIKAIGDIVRESQNMPLLTESQAPENQPLSRRTSIDFDALMDQVDTDKYTGEIPGEESCYKKVSTVEGPQLVLSVSQTFIKLKDLILEKKHLHKEIDSLKQLNSKLESKVDRQERRLYTVTTELNKTWNLVAKLKMQHNKLHNSEAVLKYELHEKRKLLERLKTELSKSRQQWAKVREKHDESELLCQRMRAEFARRRQPSSQESGAFSDSSSPSCSSPNEDINENEEPESETVVQEDEDDDVDLSGIERGFEIEVDPLEDFVSDLVQEIEAATSSVENENESNSTAEDEDVYRTNRANRLRQLEDASRVLYSRLMATTVQSSALASRLAQLHDHYGSHESTVPGTDVFPFEEIPMEPTLQQVPFNQETTDPTETDSLSRAVVYGTEEPQSEGTIEVTPIVNVELFQSGSEETAHVPVMTMTQNAEALIVEMESPALLAELAVSRIESRSPVLLQSTTTQVFDLGINHNTHHSNSNSSSNGTPVAVEAHTETEAHEEPEVPSSPDANSLSKLIIQQVPKRLEILKRQNASMRDREKYLMQEVHDQRGKLDNLEKEKKSLAERLEEEVTSKNEAIAKLQNEMADLVSTLKREKEKLSEFMKIYLEEKSDLESPQVPSTSASKTCLKCEKKFSLLRRRRHECCICKKSFCRDCTATKSDGATRTGKVCSNCSERKVLLESAAQSLL